jgi:hypothetical protein
MQRIFPQQGCDYDMPEVLLLQDYYALVEPSEWITELMSCFLNPVFRSS